MITVLLQFADGNETTCALPAEEAYRVVSYYCTCGLANADILEDDDDTPVENDLRSESGNGPRD
jgi:hypothetical protein